MRIKKALKYFSFLIALVPFASTACGSNSNRPHGLTPKYILDGTQESVDSKFVYYSINGDTEYAVGLKESAKSSSATINIPSTHNGKPVTGIWRYGFSNSKAGTINIPSGITVIDFEAFMGSSIKSVTIPATIYQMGEAVFYSCKSLTKASIQNTTTTSEASSACSCSEVIDNDEEERIPCALTNIPSFCFFNCYSLKELVLPQSIEEIEYEAFNNCQALYSTLAFMNIKAIRSRAFQNCSALKNIYISSSFFAKDPQTNQPIGVIEDKAFDKCNTNLKFYLVGDTADVQDWLDLHSDNKWRWKDETLNPATNCYAYEITASGASYTNDWIFTTVNGEVEITSYIGPTEIEGQKVKFLSIPNELPSGSGNKVRSISTDALNTVKSKLERLYLPKYLKRIEPNMFNGDYDQLIVVDDNTKCSIDETAIEGGQTLSPRIILNGLTDLEVIGNSAFVNMDHLKDITKLYLPYSLKAVGTRAFGNGSSDGKHLKAVTEFIWDYDDAKSALKVIGREAFCKMGNVDNAASITSTNGIHKNYLNNDGTTNYTLTTLVLPRTLEHFGITTNDNNTYNLGGAENNDNDFGVKVFAGCPLLEQVIIRGSVKSKVQAGSNSDGDTFNLFLPSYSFVMNENLRTVIIEERCGKTIFFHTANNDRPVFGWSAGKVKNDFGGDPSIQEIFLPNRFTTLRLARYTFQGNSRGAVYLSGTSGSNMYGHKKDNVYLPAYISSPTSNSVAVTDVKEWYIIGEENNHGYYFDKDNTKNYYGLSQYMPVYSNVFYEKTISKTYASLETFIGVGTTNSANDYVIKDKCAFVCGASTATMSNYLYDRHDSSFDGTAVVPATVNRNNGTTCTVDTIGASAFSACYCDTTSYTNYSNYKDLVAVSVPSTIATIGEYAFMRAYGVRKLSSYNASTGVSNGDYVMPSSLTSIGRQAFAFCNIEQFLNIPNSCIFYENTSSISTSSRETSVFSNNFSLRKITFGNNSTSSTYYTTTTYTHSGSSTVYTSAIYSTSSVNRNKSSLLLVLNRDSADYHVASQDVSIVSTTINGVTSDFSELNGRYATTGYLYGAFKMCYWIDSLVVGKTNQSTREQPLISGVYNVSQNKDSYLYLGEMYDFKSNPCNLKVISFGNATTIETPAYSFEGCEQLTKIRLPRVPDGHIPAGLFAYIDNSNIIFEVPSDASGNNFTECAPGVLDLTYTAYSAIDAEAFKETNINTLIAPITTDFTIETDAFANCTNLTSINFANVTGEVNLNASFRGATIPNNLFNFGSSALINFNKEAFRGCTFPGKTFTFPANTAIIGDSCFEYCNTLENVTADAVLTNLKRVVVDNGTGQNNEGNNTGFTQIGDFAFNMCTSLKNFDFSKFAGLQRIGHFAFGMITTSGDSVVALASEGNKNNTATICTNGIVELPESLTNIGVGAFHTTKVVSVTFNSHSIKFERANSYSANPRLKLTNNNGGSQFRFCYSLTTVLFTDPNCAWTTPYRLKSENGQDNYFSKCTSLTVLVLPTGYNLQCERYTGTGNNQRPDSMVWESNKNLKIYSYWTTKDIDDSKPAISIYWRRMADSDTAPVVYYVGNNDDVIKGSAGNYSEYQTGATYWTMYNGSVVYLGTATVNSSTGVVTFQTSGYTADSTGIHHS